MYQVAFIYISSFNYYCNLNSELFIIARNMWDKSIKPSQSVNKKEFIMSAEYRVQKGSISLIEFFSSRNLPPISSETSFQIYVL